MTRLGYIICACIMLGLVYFLLWSDDPDRTVFVFPEPLATPFTLSGAAGLQQYDGKQLIVDGVTRPVDRHKIKNLGKFLKRIRVKAEVILESVDVSQLDAYGLDGTHEIQYADQRYRWSILDGTGYIWHEQSARIYVLRKKIISELIKTYAHRLDQRKLLDVAGTVVLIAFDEIVLERVSEVGGWLSQQEPHRPAFNARGNEILRQLYELRLDDVHGASMPKTAEEIFTLRLSSAPSGQGPDRADTHYDIRVYQDNDNYFIRVADQPLQVFPVRRWQALDEIRQACHEDYLLDIPHGMEGLPFNQIIVQKGNEELYRIKRLGSEDEAYNIAGYSYWELMWPAGREAARPDVGVQFFNVLNNLLIDGVRLQPNSSTQPLGDELCITCLDETQNQRARVFWAADGRVRSLFHSATLSKDIHGPQFTYQQLLNPASFLNTAILPVDMRRIEKIQRIEQVPAFKGAVLKRSSLNQWQVLFYDKPGALQREESGDPGFCNRLAAAISHMQAENVRFATAADRDLFSTSDRRVDVRLAAWEINSGEDEYFLEETLARDWGIRLRRQGKAWLGINHDETLVYELSAQTVEELFADVRSGFILSVVPNQIQQMRLRKRGEAQFVLNRGEEHWETSHKNNWYRVDALQMRTFLRDLSRCQAQRIDDQQQAIAKDDVLFEIQIFIPGYEERNEQVTISIGSERDGLYPCSILTTSGIQAFAGVAWCRAEVIAAIMHDQAWFLPSDSPALDTDD